MVEITPLGQGSTTAPPSPVTLLRETVHPRGQGEQRRWLDLVMDLRAWAGQEVRLSLRTEGKHDPLNDWAGWGEPAIVRLDPMTGERMLRSTEETRRVALRP